MRETTSAPSASPTSARTCLPLEATSLFRLGWTVGPTPQCGHPELVPTIPIVPNPPSRAVVKYYGAGDLNGPNLANEGSRKYELKIAGVRRSASVNVVAVRKPLLAMSDLVGKGHAVHFTSRGC